MGCPAHGYFAPCRCGYAIALAALLIGCAPAKGPCVPVSAPTAITMADCLVHVKAECAGIPLDEPCPFEEDCKASVNASVDGACK